MSVSGRRALAMRRFKEEAVLAHVVHSPPTMSVQHNGRGCPMKSCSYVEPHEGHACTAGGAQRSTSLWHRVVHNNFILD
jgi:hypothetical protein